MDLVDLNIRCWAHKNFLYFSHSSKMLSIERRILTIPFSGHAFGPSQGGFSVAPFVFVSAATDPSEAIKHFVRHCRRCNTIVGLFSLALSRGNV